MTKPIIFLILPELSYEQKDLCNNQQNIGIKLNQQNFCIKLRCMPTSSPSFGSAILPAWYSHRRERRATTQSGTTSPARHGESFRLPEEHLHVFYSLAFASAPCEHRPTSRSPNSALTLITMQDCKQMS